MASGHGHSGSSENILKQGYLKKSVQTSDLIPSASKQIANNIKQRLEPNRWYVFVVRNRVPFLEYYDKEESIFTGSPIESYNLSSFQNLSYTMGRTNTNFTFCIFLAERTIELTAPTRAHMTEWCRVLERSLRNLGLRSKHIKEEHQYTAFPVKSTYVPTRTFVDDDDDLPSEPAFEDQLLAKVDDDSDEEPENHDYQDATSMKLDDDDKAETENPTLPLRPPPRIPRRSKPSGQEDVFASLSTVRREEMYRNLDGINHNIEQSEEHLFGSDSDSDSDDNVATKVEKTVNKRISAEEKSNEKDIDEEEDRCTSLPNIPTVPPETDTSEDSDFVSASFWLRNRRPGANTGNPPHVPERFDSVSNIPKPKPRNCISMNMDYMKPKLTLRSESPTLISLGEAPLSPGQNKDKGTLMFVENAKHDTNQNDKVLLLDNNDWYAVNSNQATHTDGKKSNSCNGSLSFEDAGVYETLTEKPKEPPRIHALNTLVNGAAGDDVYGATWECSSVRRTDSDCVENADSDDADDVCCSKEPKKLFVAMPDEKSEKGECNGHIEMRHNASETHSHKKGGVLSKIFNRKSSNDRELPERLVVDIPIEGSQRVSGGSNGPPIDENFYSDFPSPGAEPTPNHLKSDILKLSLLENGPSSDHESPPIQLPKRDFVHHTNLKQNMSKSMHDPIQGFNQDAYEPMDLSKSVNLDYQSKRPALPSPPSKSKLNKFIESNSVSEEAPIAPPRRNRKPDKTSRGHSYSPDSERKKECPPLPAGSPPIPKRRQTTREAKSPSTREPALPPRNHPDDKPAVPPPPRRSTILRATSEINGGARPKTIQLASRQQSVNQSNVLTVMNLKQNQVDILRSEIESTGGLVKVISKVHFQSGLALVECFSKIWIAGWDVKKFPRLYDKFHIGDQLISINDVQVTDLSFAQKLVKNVKAENIEISIRRLPNAKVFAIQRSAEGESLGIKRDGGTAEILYVDPLGLAYKHGLVNKPITCDGTGLCNWMLTEINMRPLNLFFKDSEIERRLLAVGRDISIVVQPSDFVKDLKKQLKKLKGYKDYLIQ